MFLAQAQAQRCPLALGEAGDFAPEVEHVARAQEQAQGDQPQQGRERMAAAGGAAGIGHCAQGVPQALELGDCEGTARAAAVARGGLTGGGQFPCAQQRAGVGGQFFEPKFFGPSVGHGIIRVVLRIAFGQSGLHPVGRLVNGAGMALRVAETLGQQRTVAVFLPPLADEFTQSRAQALAGQVRAARGFQHEEAAQLHDQFQTLGARDGIPAHGLVAGLQVPGGGAPHHDGDALAALKHQLTKPVAGLAAGPQPVRAAQGGFGPSPVLR